MTNLFLKKAIFYMPVLNYIPRTLSQNFYLLFQTHKKFIFFPKLINLLFIFPNNKPNKLT